MEEHFKNKLKNHKVDWDKEELLGSIQKELSHNHSRFDKRWLLLLPLLCISTCLGLLKVNSSYEKVAKVENSISSDFNNSNINSNDSSVVDLNKTEKQTTPSQLTNQSSDKKQTTKLNRSLASVDEHEPKDSNSLNINSSFRKIDTATSPTITESITRDRPLENTKPNTAAAVTTNPKSITINKENRNKINPIAQLPLLEIVALSYEEKNAIKLIIPKIGDLNPEQKADAKNYFFASLTGKVGLINRSINAPSNGPEYIEQLKLIEETVSSRFSHSTGFTVGYQHKSGWSLELGLGYNRIVESFNFEDTISLEAIDVVNEKAFYFINQSLDTIFFSGTWTSINSQIRKVRHNNYHSYFNIPLKVGYRYTIGNTNINSSVGISYAFVHTFKGREGQIVNQDDIIVVDNPSFDLTNKIGFHLGLGIEYPLSPRTHIFTEMAYQRSPNLSRGVIDQFYHSYSLGVGIKVVID